MVDIEQVFAYYGSAYAISVGGNLYAAAPYWRHPLHLALGQIHLAI